MQFTAPKWNEMNGVFVWSEGKRMLHIQVKHMCIKRIRVKEMRLMYILVNYMSLPMPGFSWECALFFQTFEPHVLVRCLKNPSEAHLSEAQASELQRVFRRLWTPVCVVWGTCKSSRFCRRLGGTSMEQFIGPRDMCVQSVTIATHSNLLTKANTA